MRILFYNWADYLDPSGRGGGVSVYQRATIDAFADVADVQVTFLSAGLAQSLRPGSPRWEALPPVAGVAGSERRFQLVDSLPLSPAHHAFGSPEQVDHGETVAAFARFVDAEGPFDAIHFNTLEGLPASVLGLRPRWPDTRIVVALHNYYAFCPQVNLWRAERQHCDDFEEGRACASCLPVRRDPARLRLAYGAVRALDRIGLRPGTAAYDRAVRPLARKGGDLVRVLSDRRRTRVAEGDADDDPPPGIEAAQAFAHRRAEFVRLLNAHADCVLAVSERTAEIAGGFGVARHKIATLRIGTDTAPLYGATPPSARLPRADGSLGIGYLGYMRRDKGFFFLLEALEGMHADVLARLHLTVAAASRDVATAARLAALGPRLASLRHLEGYARTDLGTVLNGVDLGIVPVLWEDNLPQVAMEMHARRIPLLTSDRGGARELGQCAALVFCAGDAGDLEQRLRTLLDRGMDLAPYWDAAIDLVSPQAHARHLLDLYASLAAAEAP